MAIFSFFKKPKHQRFDYKPRFYDPDKEDLRSRLAQYRDDPDGTVDMKNRISSGFKRKARGSSSSSYNKRSNKRLIAIMVILVWMTYYFLQKYLPIIVEAVE